MTETEIAADTTPMMIATLWQPWASLMALDEKRYETRSRRTLWRGDMAVHAAAVIPREGRLAFDREPFRSVFAAHGITRIEQLPIGVVLCVCRVVACVEAFSGALPTGASAHARPARHEVDFGDYDGSPSGLGRRRFAWLTDRLRLLGEPLPLRGSQSPRALPPAAVVAIRGRLLAERT